MSLSHRLYNIKLKLNYDLDAFILILTVLIFKLHVHVVYDGDPVWQATRFSGHVGEHVGI